MCVFVSGYAVFFPLQFLLITSKESLVHLLAYISNRSVKEVSCWHPE